MKTLLLFLLIASATAAAQKNEISVTGEGNFNPVTYVYLHSPHPAMGSAQKSSLGGGAEYDRWFSPHQAFGIKYEQNPSDGKLTGLNVRNGVAIWPQMRFEVLGLFTQKVGVKSGQVEGELKIGRLIPFIQEGAGSVITYDGTNWALAGWSHSVAIAVGSGSDYWVTNRLAVRLSALIIADQTGCYDDPTCQPSWGLSHDVGAGFSYHW